MTVTEGETVCIKDTEYEVKAVKPYPNKKRRIVDNVLLVSPDGRKFWIADFALDQLSS